MCKAGLRNRQRNQVHKASRNNAIRANPWSFITSSEWSIAWSVDQDSPRVVFIATGMNRLHFLNVPHPNVALSRIANPSQLPNFPLRPLTTSSSVLASFLSRRVNHVPEKGRHVGSERVDVSSAYLTMELNSGLLSVATSDLEGEEHAIPWTNTALPRWESILLSPYAELRRNEGGNVIFPRVLAPTSEYQRKAWYARSDVAKFNSSRNVNVRLK